MVNVTDWRAPIVLTVVWLALRSGRLVTRLPESSPPHDVGAQPSSIKMTPSLPNESTEKDDTTAANDGESNEEYSRGPHDVYSISHPRNSEESSAVSKKPEPTVAKLRPSFDPPFTETLAPAIDSSPSSSSPKLRTPSYSGSAQHSTITMRAFKPYAIQSEISSTAPSYKSGTPVASQLLPSPLPAPSVSLHRIAKTQSHALATPAVSSADVMIPAARGSRPIRNVSVPSNQRISTGHWTPESAPRKAPEWSTTLPALMNKRKRTPDQPISLPAANSIRNATMPEAKGRRDKCTLERFFCRVPSAGCSSGSRKKAPCVKKLFITGTAGSGTHYVAHYLSKISGKQITVKHEGPGSRTDVLVSWPSRCPGPDKLDFKALGFPEAKLLKPPMVQWANKQLGGRCMFSAVVHLVRHPLRFLSSNFAFGQCLECWALVERLTIPSIAHLTVDARKVIAENRRSLYSQTGGRDWDAPTRRILIRAFTLYWNTWNAMISEVADERVRVEDVNMPRLCIQYGLGSESQCNQQVKEEAVKKVSHGGGQDKVTWSEVEGIDAALAKEMWVLAQSYGYSREPPAK